MIKVSTRTFTSPKFGSIRTAGTSEKPLFCLRDLSKALGYTDTIETVRLRKEDLTHIRVDNYFGGHPMVFTTIRGMRDAILHGHKDGSLLYQWLSRDVIPVLTAGAEGASSAAEETKPPVKTRPDAKESPAPPVRKAAEKDASSPAEKEAGGRDTLLMAISQFDKAVEYAVATLGGIGSDIGVEKHLDTLMECCWKSKDAILEIAKDIVLCGRGS